MGEVKIIIKIQNEIANTKLEADKPTVSDLSVALTHLELMKMNILGKIAKNTKLNKLK